MGGWYSERAWNWSYWSNNRGNVRQDIDHSQQKIGAWWLLHISN